MTPKEKAKRLIDEFLYTENEYKEYADYTQAKQCALIAVYEMLYCLNNDDLYIEGETNINEFINFYEKVKQELENL